MARGIRYRRSYAGNGATANIVTNSSPLTIKRELLATGQIDLISEAQAYGETFDYFSGFDVPHSEALADILACGRVATRYAVYERAV